ncbi:phosphopyruvate hydratase [Candidatus Peregrinibacteria bacterium]|jgi:enolase|nr:phosphopyruvate hydratase [Candidatus Peregrinibacteria bacterium]MBT6730689.1 phosphopyruvate hydratase [Candidatus Peregrinibacteria bacterium]MBT7009132.1 phosphopyruvate hydratase [Candidatus Peregrinibacteria bacterium]MBT7345292.1 phosphopyruvate hydratase [Candidatus Peregrinibacteria bacterium]MBT7928516.1 phosphopyruvate hydratase [Candidatus Peregrinibacteria bacterium]
MSIISSLFARQILDSRGNPTVEVDCTLDDGSFGRSAVPSGASTGSHEALELRDGDKSIYCGKSVTKAVSNVNDVIAPALDGVEIKDHRAVDKLMLDLDGTKNKTVLGANAILGVSMAVCRARAKAEGVSLFKSLASQFGVEDAALLPTPMMNVINGGKHADSGLSFQECMIIPTGFDNFTDALRAGAETFHTLKKLLKEAGYTTSVGDEGGFAPQVKNADEAFDFLMKAIDKAGYTGKISIAIDAAASEFFVDGKYDVDGKKLSSSELTEYYSELVNKYPLVIIEDSHNEDDWDGFTEMMTKMGDNVQLVGDDLLVTNVERIKQAQDKKAVNSVLIKLNQIGSVTETVDAIKMTQDNGWQPVVSHRSGETEDAFIAHLAVGLRTGQIKTGSLSRTDRVCKYNELLRIEEELGGNARY